MPLSKALEVSLAKPPKAASTVDKGLCHRNPKTLPNAGLFTQQPGTQKRGRVLAKVSHFPKPSCTRMVGRRVRFSTKSCTQNDNKIDMVGLLRQAEATAKQATTPSKQKGLSYKDKLQQQTSFGLWFFSARTAAKSRPACCPAASYDCCTCSAQLTR